MTAKRIFHHGLIEYIGRAVVANFKFGNFAVKSCEAKLQPQNSKAASRRDAAKAAA